MLLLFNSRPQFQFSHPKGNSNLIWRVSSFRFLQHLFVNRFYSVYRFCYSRLSPSPLSFPQNYVLFEKKNSFT